MYVQVHDSANKYVLALVSSQPAALLCSWAFFNLNDVFSMGLACVRNHTTRVYTSSLLVTHSHIFSLAYLSHHHSTNSCITIHLSMSHYHTVYHLSTGVIGWPDLRALGGRLYLQYLIAGADSNGRPDDGDILSY